MLRVNDIRKLFKEKLFNQEYITDKSKVRCIELLGVVFIADENYIFGTPNKKYIERELQWYLSQSLNVNDIPGETPAVWKMVATPDGRINSNYGWCIFSDENFNQYQNVLNELKENPFSRRAQMIYTRPSMWKDYNKDGMSDFICTTAVSVYIRENKLYYIVNQRSCDVIYGYKNDVMWHRYVFDKLLKDLKETYPDLEQGDLIYQVNSLHVYQRHFDIVRQFVL